MVPEMVRFSWEYPEPNTRRNSSVRYFFMPALTLLDQKNCCLEKKYIILIHGCEIKLKVLTGNLCITIN
jgi:hypothetical protein